MTHEIHSHVFSFWCYSIFCSYILLRVLLALVVRKGLEWQCCEITTPWMSLLLDRAPVEAIAEYGRGASSNFGNHPYFWSRGCARPSLGEQNVTLAVNICFDIGASFDPKNIEGNSGEWYYGKIVSNQSNSWCDNHIGTWEYERYRFAKLHIPPLHIWQTIPDRWPPSLTGNKIAKKPSIIPQKSELQK